MPGNQPSIAIDTNGVMRRLQAAPWPQGEQKERSDTEWKEDYRQYQLAQVRQVQPIRRLPEQDRFFVALGTETLTSALKALLETVQAPDAATASWDKGVLVLVGLGYFATFRLGLEAGDCITHGDGKPLATRADAVAWLESAIQASDKAPTAQLGLMVLRAGRKIDFQYRTLPVRRKQSVLTLSREEAMAMLDAELLAIPNCGTVCRPSPPGIAYAAPFMEGMGKDTVFAPTGLWASDIIMQFDKQSFSEFEPIKEHLAELKQKIGAGEATAFSVHVLRGPFEELDITYTIANVAQNSKMTH